MPGRYAYTRRQRLLKGTDFEAVFAARLYYRSRSYLVMCRPNELGYARLGMVVGKRQFKRAVDRNRMRRIIRETFRLHHPDLPAMDVVVKVQSVPPEGEEGAELAAVLARLK
ncbi:MAG: ribonuclease P protein component [Thiobacillaceae bacterium]